MSAARLHLAGTAAASGPAPARLSAEVFSIPLDADRYLVYAPLRRAAFVANSTLVNRLADIGHGNAGLDATTLALLRRLDIVDGAPDAPPLTTPGGDPEPTFVSLLLTTACNLRCSYCYASAGDTPPRHMPLDVARQGIDFVSGNARRRGEPAFEVAFHGGGEPTVNWKTLVGATDYARARARALALDVRITAATNGVLSDAQIAWLVANLDGVSLSFDGLPRVQDTHRPLISGAGSSARVEYTLRRLDAAAFPYGIRVTVTHAQIANLPASIRYICSQFAPARIQVEPAYPMGRWRDAPSAETRAFIDAYRRARQIARDLGNDIGYSAARLDVLSNHFCALSQDGFSLAHDGQVTACYEVFDRDRPHAAAFFYGRARGDGDGYDFDHTALHELRRTSVEHKPFCAGCFAKWHCAGDCHHRSLCGDGDGAFHGSERCHITRALIRDLILERIHATGGVAWHAPDHDGCAERNRLP